MKFPCYIITYLLLFSLSAQAQSLKTFALSREKQVPASVRRLSPPQSKSVFFGTAKIGTNRSDIFLHYYTLPNLKKTDAIPYQRLEYLDLLKRESYFKHGKRLSRFRRLNTISLTEPEASWFTTNDDSPSFHVFEGAWLRPKAQTGPILVFSHHPDSAYLFITFPKGLSGKPTLQQFGSGINSNGNSWVETNFSEIDEREFMVINVTSAEANGDQLLGGSDRYYWNGTKFALRMK